MIRPSHTFVHSYKGPIAFGLSREVDEASFKYFIQKFSSDELLETICGRLSDEELHSTITHLTGLMRNHLSDEEYHRLFLGED